MNIKFLQAISTRMACIDNEVQKAEREFLKDLQAVTKFDIQGETRTCTQAISQSYLSANYLI